MQKELLVYSNPALLAFAAADALPPLILPVRLAAIRPTFCPAGAFLETQDGAPKC